MNDPYDLSTIPHPPHILLVNGPPRSGKDTVGEILATNYPGKVYVTKMAKALKERTHGLYNLFVSGSWEPLRHDFFEDCKDKPSDFFMGITPREAYIAVSERLMKPLHGARVWGDLLVEDIALHGNDSDLVVVTDSGFADEALPVIERYGACNVSLVRLSRPGTSFQGDSRSYINLPVYTHMIDNDGTMTQLAEKLVDRVPGFYLEYAVEVQLPAGPTKMDWFQQGRSRDSLQAALAALEALRQTEYGTRVLRVRAGKDNIVRLVMPGDAPVCDLL